MNMVWPPPKPVNPFALAMAKLRDLGFSCAASDIPGLTVVSGNGLASAEMTMGQVISFAASK